MKEITIEILKVALRKLLTTTYYDKTDLVMRRRVATFVKSLESPEEEERIFAELLDVANGIKTDLLERWLQQVSLIYYPKKVGSVNEEVDNHVITNVPPKSVRVERLLVKVDIPVELCILDVAWLLLYGYKVDSKLHSNSYGNRMDLIPNNSGVRIGNALFHKYQNKYKAWWENGIKAANEELKKKEDVTIINFDIANCYHSIDFDFDDFFAYYDKFWAKDKIREDSLTGVLVKIYQRYWEITQASDEEVFRGRNEGKRPMPLALLSAHVLANWYLNPLDDFILKSYEPIYYGRYVDDCMVVVKTKSKEGRLNESIQEELPDLIEIKEEIATFAFAQREKDSIYHRIASFELQLEKLYVYRFDCVLPQSTLDKFVQDQMERSSEFRFLTDEADTGNVNLEFVTLVNTLDAEEEPGRRFSILEENRYKLAVYLAKLSTKLAKYGKGYEHYAEVEKVFSYFTGGLLIKHYQLWERLMTVYVLAGRKDYVAEFCKAVIDQIKSLRVKEELFKEDLQAGKQRLMDSLTFHLEQSKIMALSLYKQDDDVDTIYLDTYMVRMHYNRLPLQEFYKDYKTRGVCLTMKDSTMQNEWDSYRWMPYYVKYYAIVNALSIGKVYNAKVFKQAFKIYCRLNHIGHTFDWKAFCRLPQDDDWVTEFNTDLAYEPLYDDVQTVSVVEMDIPDGGLDEVIDDFERIYPDKIKLFDDILDQITKIFKTNIFILPELSLPIYMLNSYCRYAATHEKAFVAGMEYIVINGVVYNYIITCLPITLYGQRDAVPVIRLKNHYAPEETNLIKGKGLKVPQPRPVWQNLYHWHGHVFTTYYCYELANVVERSFFFSKIDAMYCPVFNKDTYYYNNIAESMARDMHCYFVLCNVSHYGDSRVTKPAPHMEMNLLKVKGGNTTDNKAVVLSATIDVNSLRKFQLLSEEQQHKHNKESIKKNKPNKVFKQTPPNYEKEQVIIRKNRFMYPHKDFEDAFLSNLAEIVMKY